MKLLSVNVSLPKRVAYKGKTTTTGIFKEPVDGRVMLRTLNLDGDGQADLKGHGGIYKAAYVYSIESYDYWIEELGRDDLTFGHFGENLTVEGMLDENVHVGDVFRIGSAVAEVTQPRVPCFKLGIKMGTEGFERTFLESLRVGFYLRVVEEGEVGAGDVIERIEADPVGMTVREINNLGYFDTHNLDEVRRALRIRALSPGWRQWLERRLTKAKGGAGSGTRLRSLRVDRKVRESETITSFYLKSEDREPLSAFAPGQFLPLSLDIPGQGGPVTRTYSLSDSPGHRDYYRLSIKREPAPRDRPHLPPGLASNYLHDRVEPGTRLKAAAPRGKFVLDPQSERPVALLSAGVGLTPMISMLNAIVESGSGRPTWFIHGARNGREQAFGAHLRRVAEERRNVRVHVRYSRRDPQDVEGRDYDSEGRVDAALVRRLLTEDGSHGARLRRDDFDFYLCGPPLFIKALYEGLREWDVPEPRIHYELFGPATAIKSGAGSAAASAATADCCTDIEVTFARSGVTASWNPSLESILELAEACGLSPAYTCRSGICHTCECDLEAGEVEYVEEPVDPPEEGSVLICCSKPKTDVVVDV